MENVARENIILQLVSDWKKIPPIYSSLFFIHSKALGLVILALTCLHPNVGLVGLFSLAVSLILLQVFRLQDRAPLSSAVLLNALLTGLLIGDLFVFEPKLLLFIGLTMLFNLVLTAAIDHFFGLAKLPTLSVSFSITAVAIILLRPHLAFYADATLYFSELTSLPFLPQGLALFFRSLASIFCTPDVAIGLVIWLAVMGVSPLTGLFLAVGFFVGTTAESVLSLGPVENMRYQEGFNYSLVFAAFAGCFMTPSRFSLGVAIFATVFTAGLLVVLSLVLAPLQLQVMAAPFNLMTLTLLLALKNLRPFSLAGGAYNTPEEGVERTRSLWRRHRFGELGLCLPVQGRWLIQQGFEGKLTHLGLWKHALDFVAVDANNKIFSQKGLELTDYFAYGQDVLSPVYGTVVACMGSDPDNIIGKVTNTRNWGNYIVLQTAGGLCVTLAHLKKDSLKVKLGEYVEVGKKIGEVGNSGYSQEPHLHVQAQWLPVVGAYTAPFHLLNFGHEKAIHFHGVPETEQVIYSVAMNQASERSLNFKVGENMDFILIEGGKQIESGKQKTFTISTVVDEWSGAFHLTDGTSRLYFGKVGVQFYFYGLEGSRKSILWDLFTAAPKIPMIYGKQLDYEDELPASIANLRILRRGAQIGHALGLHHGRANARYSIDEQGLQINGLCRVGGRQQKTHLKMDPAIGFTEFSVGSKKYVRSI